MSTHKGHIVGGAATFLLLHIATTKVCAFPQPTPKALIIAFSCCILGALFPDIDTKSIGQRIFYSFMAIPVTYSIFSHQWHMLASLSIISLFPILSNHRGITHTLWFVTLAPLSIMLGLSQSYPQFVRILQIACFYFIAGALSHLLLDFGLLRTLKKWR